MKKNYTKYGPTGLLWALYLIVGVVAFLVSDFYFKFELKDAIIFAAINFVGVIIFTEGIDFIFKLVKRRQAKAGNEEEPAAEAADETEEAAAEPAAVVEETPVVEEANAEDEVLVVNYYQGTGKGVRIEAALRPAASAAETDTEEAVVAPAVEEPVAEPVVEPQPSAPVAAEEDETAVSEDAPVSPRRGRRANLDAVVDAPTVSIEVITQDMVDPAAPVMPESVGEEPIVEAETPTPQVAAADTISEEPLADAKSLSAEEFLSTTKLTSPRAIVREYQRLGGKEDIFALLMERQK